jgi:hypothetical protein
VEVKAFMTNGVRPGSLFTVMEKPQRQQASFNCISAFKVAAFYANRISR